MDKKQAASDIIAKALAIAPFDGWNQQMLGKAALDAGYKKTDVIRVFPGGAITAVEALMEAYDRQMVEALSGYHLESMKIRERITLAVHVKLDLMAADREAVRRALALLAMPIYCQQSLKLLYHTVDAIWHAAGDNSTDFNFYSKRLMLAGVYTTTLRFWLDDKSEGHAATWAFLDRRIADVMRIEKAKAMLTSGKLFSFLRARA